MQTLRFLPLVVLAGVDGFVLFVPYLALIGAAAVVMNHFKRDAEPLPAAL